MLNELCQMMEHIKMIHSTMGQIATEAKVSIKKYVALAEDLEGIPQSELKERYDFLTSLRDNEYKAAKEVLDLLPKQVWEHYKLLGQHELAEQRILNQKLKAFRERINEYTRSKKPSKPSNSKSQEGSIQSNS